MKVFPHVVKPPRKLREITPGMSAKEAAAIYAETLTAIPGLTEADHELFGPDEEDES
jgi:hypothetical protein